MQENIRKLVENKGFQEIDLPALKVLGDENGLHAIADFWTNNEQLMHIIGINEELEWMHENEFTSGESAAFLAGLAAYPTFMQQALVERESLNKAEEVDKEEEV